MFTDVRGHSITTQSETAANAFNEAVEKFIQRKVDVVPLLQKSLAADPDCAMSQAVFGLMLHGARNSALKGQMATVLGKAHALEAGTDRERHYVSALDKAVAGDLFGMVNSFEDILLSYPTDLLALVLCQGELFWLGDLKRSSVISAQLDNAWSNDTAGYADYLSVRAFDLEEIGDYARAEDIGRRAVEQRGDCIWGAHAVAHVLLMQSRHDEGIHWLQSLQSNWQSTNQMKYHLWWHQCLFHLERKEHDAVLEVYDRWVRNHQEALVEATPDLYIDIQNGASMLWRLEHSGVDVGRRWHEMAELVVLRIDDMSSPFTSAHYAMILAAVGQYGDCETLVQNMLEFTQRSDHALASRYADAALPASQGAIAHRQGDYAKALDCMLPARHDFWKMGGSHAQQDVFFQILVDAAHRLGRADLTKMLLDDIEVIGFTEPARQVAYERVGAF